jgi:conjugative relaxase-like TrwC/TraI family protein
VLNITAQNSAEGAKAYFSKSDYLSEGQELVGEWQGEAAKALGLSGTVQKKDFDLLCDNFNPATGEQLTKVTREGRRVGYDMTFSAPKSVSVVHALTGDESVMTAFRDSIRETMKDMEQEFATRVRKGGQDIDRTTGNWVVAEFVHLTSRPVDQVPCPQLHMHAFVFNATYDHIEDQWKAGQFGDLKRDAYYWQAVQQARFANKLQEVGYSVNRTKDAFEITGVPKSVLEKFSLRTKVIEDAAERLGIINPKSKAKLGATTRERKNDRYSYNELIDLWKKRLTPEEHGAVVHAFADKDPHKPVMENATHAQYAVEH